METQVKVDGPGRIDLKGMKIVGWKAKVEDKQEWNRIVEQNKTHPGLQSEQKKKKKKKKIEKEEEVKEEEKKKKKKKKNKKKKVRLKDYAPN